MKIGFFLLGKKGFCALDEFLKVFGAAQVAYVVSARDSGVENDWHNELSELCKKHLISFSMRNEKSTHPKRKAQYTFAIGWRWIIEESEGLVVFHDSILPQYRGFSPLVNMLINGETKIGVTALKASPEYDQGDIIYQETTLIQYPIKIIEAIDCVIPLYTELVIKTARDIFLKGQLSSFPQDETLASYSLWRDESDYFIDWKRSSGEIQRFVDAVGRPYGGARSLLNGEIVCVDAVSIVNDVLIENRNTCVGKVLSFENNHPVVVCMSGLLKIVELRKQDGSSLIGNMRFRSRFEALK